ncbi:PstS family phosphate ABC transporter substrate-binding protein [Paenibacillus agri]|uniref:Substrate-binding domain-containing protein n=1 Tax=Paenibacillus agri TaxID=2744309 RepID=A0A850EV99_9BACL|nr:substrate-binding domain-containing protein [Paenibacillus agri]NUU63354.1 substrate-binding domain-containing protein [Paenibacillus agri]
MKESFWTKLLLSVVAVGGIALIGFITTLITALNLGLKFYVPLLITATAFLAAYSVITIFQILKRRTRHIVLLSFAGLCLLSTAGFELSKVYVNSFGEINEQEVNLAQYAPFVPDSKAAALTKPTTFTIREDLPRLDGATALYPLYASFAQAVYPSGEYQPYGADSLITCSTTPVAYKRLLEGEVDMIFAAAPSQSQLKEAQQRGVQLKLTPIGREAFVFFVNRRNPVKGLTIEQIKHIYSGKITNWKEVGGSNNGIRAFQRPEDSGSQTMLQKVMGNTPLMTPPQEDVADLMSGIISRTANYRNFRNALGYSFLFYASELNRDGEIALLEIDGIRPERTTIRNGEYPFATEFYAVTAGSSNPNIEPFLDWITSPQGQELVEKTGYTSLK